MSLKYIKSERGTNILVDGGYMYQRECNTPKKTFGGVCSTNKNVEEESVYLMMKK